MDLEKASTKSWDWWWGANRSQWVERKQGRDWTRRWITIQLRGYTKTGRWFVAWWRPLGPILSLALRFPLALPLLAGEQSVQHLTRWPAVPQCLIISLSDWESLECLRCLRLPAAQLTLGYCWVRINQSAPWLLWMCMYMRPFGSVKQ